MKQSLKLPKSKGSNLRRKVIKNPLKGIFKTRLSVSRVLLALKNQGYASHLSSLGIATKIKRIVTMRSGGKPYRAYLLAAGRVYLFAKSPWRTAGFYPARFILTVDAPHCNFQFSIYKKLSVYNERRVFLGLKIDH